MIQRIQSVFLGLAALLNLAVLFVPSWQFTSQNDHEMVSGMGILVDFADIAGAPDKRISFTANGTHTAFFALSIAASAMLLFTLLQFKERPRQLMFTYAATLLLFAEIMALVLFTNNGPTVINAGKSDASLGFAFPVVAVLLVWLAMRAIRKDEELVKSVNRFR